MNNLFPKAEMGWQRKAANQYFICSFAYFFWQADNFIAGD